VSEHSDTPTDEPITLINVFEVPADAVDDFAELWRDRARIMSTAPGFRDSRLHRAISDGARFQFVNVAHWDSRAAWEAAEANPEFRARINALDPRIRVGANPALYRVAVEFAGHRQQVSNR
jgi:heme-degrading monooxygenase HmoA